MRRDKDKAVNWLQGPDQANLSAYLMSPEFASAVLERFESDQQRMITSREHDRMMRSWRMYYLRGDGGKCDDTQLNTSGDRDEVVNLAPALYRRLQQDRLSLVMQTPPDPEPRALNTDAESQAQCSLVLGLLDHYKTHAHLEELGLERFEMSGVMGSSFMHIRWDSTIGDIAAADAQQQPIYTGDLVFSVRSRYDVAYDPTSPDNRRPRWWIVCEPMNRFDLIAQYGAESREIKRAIENADTWSSRMEALGYEHSEFEYDDSVGVYWVYAEATASVPAGVKALVLNDRTVLFGGPLDEDRAGVFPLWPSRVMFRSEGHTNNFGGMPVAQAYGAQISTIMSNHATYGLAKTMGPRELNITPRDLSAGLTHFEYDHADKLGNAIPKPEMFGEVGTPSQLFTLLEVLQELLDLVMGGSAALRGDPNATRGDSGSKVAALFAAAQQIAAGDVRAKMRSDEEVFSFIVSSTRRHLTAERTIAIAGVKNSYTAKRFKGESLNRIDRVPVRQSDPARDTFTGRMKMAELLATLPPEQRADIQAVAMTGRLESATVDLEAARLRIERENDQLADENQPMPVALKSDPHDEDLKKHFERMNGDDVRHNPAAVQRFEQHCAQHIARLMPASPEFAGFELLAATGQRPLPVAPLASAGGGVGPGKAQQPESQSQQQRPLGGPAGPTEPQGSSQTPRQAKLPKNPIDGETMAGTGPGEPAMAGPS